LESGGLIFMGWEWEAGRASQRVVEILRREFEMAMKLTGRASIASIDRSVIWEL
jgi:isopentenyl diphosphate isomerase/L-lactate dehydrogenase-like FMN-dependent dehydrogenase